LDTPERYDARGKGTWSRRAQARHVRRFLGLDLAWSRANPSGLAAIDESGRVIDARADLRSDAEIIAWVRAHAAPVMYLALDMPTIIRNPAGARPCELELRGAFGGQHAGPHPANLTRFPDGGRAAALLAELRADGIEERCDLEPRAAGRFAFEVFPHPAHVRLFGLARIFRYKKKPGRSWPQTLAEWDRYRRALVSLRDAEPPLRLNRRVPRRAQIRGYKRFDDLLDGVSCAYIAQWIWRWGTHPPHVRTFGDRETGYVLVPDRAALPRRPACG
jgi:predicted RNase H-like nuclease